MPKVGLISGLSQILNGVRQAMERLGTLMSQWLNGISHWGDSSKLLDCSDLMDWGTKADDQWQALELLWQGTKTKIWYGPNDEFVVEKAVPWADVRTRAQIGLDNWSYRPSGVALISSAVADNMGEDAIQLMEEILEMKVCVSGMTHAFSHRSYLRHLHGLAPDGGQGKP